MSATRATGRGPKKIFHKISEVCEATKTEPYVLRYWEKEFPFLAPEKNRAGQRIYTEDDIQMVLTIKRLLYEEGYTTAGARRRLAQEMGGRAEGVGPEREAEAARAPVAEPASTAPGQDLKAALRAVRDSLAELRSLLAEGAAEGSPGPAAALEDEAWPAAERKTRRPVRPRTGR